LRISYNVKKNNYFAGDAYMGTLVKKSVAVGSEPSLVGLPSRDEDSNGTGLLSGEESADDDERMTTEASHSGIYFHKGNALQ
jgi:hypothetical protein